MTSKVCENVENCLKLDPEIVTPALVAPPNGLNESTHGPRNGALEGGGLVQFAAAAPDRAASTKPATSAVRTNATHRTQRRNGFMRAVRRSIR